MELLHSQSLLLTLYRFMYAGEQNQGGGKLLYNQVQENVKLDAVYILSLPAFAWFRADYYADHPRYMHT